MHITNQQTGSWQPRRCQNPWKPNNHSAHTEVYRRMLGILNRVTDQKLQILLQQAVQLPVNEERHLSSIISLIIIKSQDEPLFINTYAAFCSELFQQQSARTALTESCKEHFLRSFDDVSNLQKTLKMEERPPVDQVQQEILMRKRITVHIGFIVSLEKKRLMPRSTLIWMAELLLHRSRHSNDESDSSLEDVSSDDTEGAADVAILARTDLCAMECLCRLLDLAGAKLNTHAQNLISSCSSLVDELLASGTMPTRIRFLLQETRYLCDNNWRRPRRDTGGRGGRG